MKIAFLGLPYVQTNPNTNNHSQTWGKSAVESETSTDCPVMISFVHLICMCTV